ncbi:MAG: RHS repeat domain-containing protein [bacterium]
MRLPAVEDPENGDALTRPTTTYAYDDYGNQRTITDAKGRQTSFTYDAFSRRLTRTLPGGKTETSTYDALGNLATHADFKGNTTVCTYDYTSGSGAGNSSSSSSATGTGLSGRLVKKEIFAHTADPQTDPADVTVSYSYDALVLQSRFMDSR